MFTSTKLTSVNAAVRKPFAQTIVFRRMAKILLCSAMLFPVSCARGALHTPEKFKIALEPEKTKFFIGELLLLHYRIDNLGDTAFSVEFGGDRRGTVRSTRFKVRALDKDGTAMPDPYPYAEQICMGGHLHSPDVKPGKPIYEWIDLSDFARIEKPGKYTVEVYHNLGWPKISGKDGRTAVAEIEFVMPNPAEAEQVARATLSMKETKWESPYERHKPHRELQSLAHNLYLPILKAMAREGTADALTVIGRIETAEGTQALIDLLETKDLALLRRVVRTLSERLPEPPGTKHEGFYEVLHGIENYRTKLARVTWRKDFAPAVRAVGRRFLQSEAAEDRDIGEYIFKCIGKEEDGAPPDGEKR